MKTVTSLNRNSIETLRDLVRKNRERGPVARQPRLAAFDAPPGHYIARTPEDGIPGKNEDDEYQFAECTLLRLDITTQKLVDVPTTRRVWNFSVIPIPGEKVINIHVDAWGQYVAEPFFFGTVLFKAPSGGIPGRSGTTSGSAVCDLLLADYSDSGQNITVKNWATSTVCSVGDRYGWAQVYDDSVFVIAEDCG